MAIEVEGGRRLILHVPTTLLAKMSIDLKFVKLMADVLDFFFIKYVIYEVELFEKANWAKRRRVIGHVLCFCMKATMRDRRARCK